VKFSSVVSIQIFSLKNANPSVNEIHMENDYFPLPSKFKMLDLTGNPTGTGLPGHLRQGRPLSGGRFKKGATCLVARRAMPSGSSSGGSTFEMPSTSGLSLDKLILKKDLRGHAKTVAVVLCHAFYIY
jgi:hypothetical protein